MAETVTKSDIVVSPGEGSGNTQLSFKATKANIGNRVKKTGVFSVQATNGPKVDVTANLEPAAEYVSFDNGANQAVAKGGGVITVTGKSNSSKLTFTKGTGAVIPADISAVTYTAAGNETVNGVAIDGDPGANATYTFTLTLTAAKNETVSARSQTITVTANSTSVTKSISLDQAAGDPTLLVTPTTITVKQDGTATTAQVTTNTTFTIS